jgi:integrase
MTGAFVFRRCNMGAYCWVKRRGRVYYLHFSKRTGRKPVSLNTSDRTLAREAQRRAESEAWCSERGIKRRIAERLRYSDLLRRFVEHKQAGGIDPKTLTNYLKTLNQFGAFLQSDMFIDAITPEHLEAFISHRRQSPRQHGEGFLAPKSLRNEVFTLVNVFAWAAERDLLLENPMRKVSKPRRVVYDAPRALTYDEYLRLKEAITNEKFSDVVDFYLLTGIRRSDGLTLTAENFDLVQMTATFAQHKTGTHKVVPIGPELAAVVRRMVERAGPGQPLIQLHPSRLTDNFRAARTRAGLPASLTFHSLRHTFASWLAALGTDFKTLQALIGHSSGQATEIYLHAFDPNKRSAIEKLTLPRKAVNA